MRVLVLCLVSVLLTVPAGAVSPGGAMKSAGIEGRTNVIKIDSSRFRRENFRKPGNTHSRRRSNVRRPDRPRHPHRKPKVGFGLVINLGDLKGDDEPRRVKKPKTRKPRKRVTRQRRRLPKPLFIADKRYRKKQVVIVIKQNRSQRLHRNIARRYGLRLLRGRYYPLLKARIQSYRIPDRRSVGVVLAQLKRERNVFKAQPVYLYSLTSGASKSAGGLQYSHSSMRVDQAHEYALGRRVKIAVIDTGLDKKHPEFRKAKITQYNAVKPKRRYIGHKHGTAIAGVLAAQKQMKGIAPAAHILDARAFFISRKTGKPETDTMILLNAFQWAYDNGAQIFNMSFEGPKDPVIEDAIQAIHEKGRVFVGAAGNGGPKAKPAYPAAYKYVIATTAVDKADRVYKHANRGKYLSLAAPGVEVMVPSTSNSYGFDSGTSIATAHISGLVALMLERQPKLSSKRIRDILRATARDLGKPGPDNDYGAGLADAYSSLQEVGLTSK